MLKIFKNIFFFKAVKEKKKKKIQQKYYDIFFISLKQNKERLLLIPENIGDTVFIVCKTKIPTEYREKGIRCFQN